MSEFSVNEFGTPVSVHTCAVCGNPFTICPPDPTETECLDKVCPSYDPARDADKFFGPDPVPGVVREPIEQIRELPGGRHV